MTSAGKPRDSRQPLLNVVVNRKSCYHDACSERECSSKDKPGLDSAKISELHTCRHATLADVNVITVGLGGR